MKIQELLDTYYEASGKTSDISRQLAFAGIAIIWVLRVGANSDGILFSSELIVPLYCFAFALVADLGQYIYKTIIWGLLNWHHWRNHKDNNADVDVSSFTNLPTQILFWAKVVLVVYAYIGLLCFLQPRLS